ncbi:MAG TPA: D-amino acid aminotransferase [Ramlibacter sp.]|nr:D-amino acid aminotransferase [Ramlibacter sp.]
MSDASLPDLPCYLNGEFSTLREAKVSVMDRGFIFGDGAYEVVPVYAGRPFCFDQHMARLQRSLGALRIDNPMTLDGWHGLVEQLVVAYAGSQGLRPQATDQLVYIQVTRGAAVRDHVMPQGLVPTVFATSSRLNPPSAQARAEGVACVSADDFRWEKAHIKSISLAGAVLARQIGADVGAAETVMFRDGFLSEAAASNVWVVQGGRVLGPPRDNLVLEGIRYGLIEQLCRDAGIPFELRRIARAEVFGADELLLSSATKEVLPVTRLDGLAIGSGRPGPIYQQLHAGYQRAKIASAP